MYNIDISQPIKSFLTLLNDLDYDAAEQHAASNRKKYLDLWAAQKPILNAIINSTETRPEAIPQTKQVIYDCYQANISGACRFVGFSFIEGNPTFGIPQKTAQGIELLKRTATKNKDIFSACTLAEFYKNSPLCDLSTEDKYKEYQRYFGMVTSHDHFNKRSYTNVVRERLGKLMGGNWAASW